MRAIIVALAILVAAAGGALIALEVGRHAETVQTTTTTRGMSSLPAPRQSAQTKATLKAGCEAGSELSRQIENAAYVTQVPTGIGSAFQTVIALGDEGYPAAYAKVAADANDIAGDSSLDQRLGQDAPVLTDLSDLAQDCAALGVSTG